MNPDVYLAAGIVFTTLSVPAMVSALTDGRPPRAASIVLLIGGGLIVLAVSTQPGGYAFADIPGVFARVLARFIN